MTASASSAQPGRRALNVAITVPIVVGGGAISVAGYIAAADPSSAGIYPGCVIRSVTGWSCPGCGLTRATHHLLHGDIGEAIGHNALVVPVLVMLTLTWSAWLVGSLGFRAPWVHRSAVPAWVGVAVVAMMFAIVRNLPWFAVPRG